MQKITVFIIAAIVILAGMVFIPVGQSDEIETSFGFWKIEIYGVNQDNELIKLNPSSDFTAQMLSWIKNGEEISQFVYRLYAKATGSGFTQCELDLSDMRTDAHMWKGSGGPGSWVHTWNDEYGSASQTIPLDNSFHLVYERTYALPSDNGGDGSYTIQLRMQTWDYVYFRGLASQGNGDWQTDSIEMDAIIPLEYDDGGGEDPGDPPSVDVNQDGVINDYDVDIVWAHREGEAPYEEQYDLNQDGYVNIFDVSVITNHPDYEPGYGGGTQTYGLTVEGFPATSILFVEVEGLSRENSYIHTWQVEPGTYTCWACHQIYGTKSETVTVTDGDVHVNIYIFGAMICPMTFTVEINKHIYEPYIINEGQYLGEL